MKTTITVDIESQLRDSHSKGFEDGYAAGILRAVEILKDTTTEHIEAPQETFCDRVISELKCEPITRRAHKKHKWNSWLKPFAKALIDGKFTKAELIDLGSKEGLTNTAVNKKAWELGFTCKKGDTIYTKTHSPKTYKLQEMMQELQDAEQ